VITIRIVDDDPVAAQQLVGHIRRYQAERQETFAVDVLMDGAQLVEQYRSDVDILFLDVDMPGMDGFTAAQQIRQLDSDVVIVFVTALGHYAIRGYEVGALSYLVKPVPYFAFSQQLMRSVAAVRRRPVDDFLVLPTRGGIARIPTADIVYAESARRHTVVHTADGAYQAPITLKQLEDDLSGRAFYRSNNCYVVNLRHVTGVQEGDCLLADGSRLAISRSRRRGFMAALTDHFAGAGPQSWPVGEIA
jgi:DNA-binding LytR/AlgR family response regulator